MHKLRQSSLKQYGQRLNSKPAKKKTLKSYRSIIVLDKAKGTYKMRQAPIKNTPKPEDRGLVNVNGEVVGRHQVLAISPAAKYSSFLERFVAECKPEVNCKSIDKIKLAAQ